MKKVIGEKIKKIRMENNLKQQEFAKKVDITQASLSAYETGKKMPSIDVLIKISEFFGKSMDYLCKDCDYINQEVKNSTSRNENISCDWLTGNNNVRIKKMYTSDIITLLTELDILKKVDVEKIDNDSNEEYIFKIITNGEQAAHVYSFIEEWKKVQASLKTMDNAEMKERFYELWIKDKLEHYKNI